MLSGAGVAILLLAFTQALTVVWMIKLQGRLFSVEAKYNGLIERVLNLARGVPRTSDPE